MLSYPIDEAEELLSSRLATAKKKMANCEEDLDFLREQITVGVPLTSSTKAGLLHYKALADKILDHGSSNSEGVQLGCYNEAERKE